MMTSTHTLSELATAKERNAFKLWMKHLGFRNAREASAVLGLKQRQVQCLISGHARPTEQTRRLMGAIAKGFDPREAWPAE